ncbi:MULTISPECIES: MGMT family protein [Frankia]|uniref:MGMT family protein n=1 Tax=Frankia TaxID=1854 RepID=UPI0005A53C45|nr:MULTISPECIES: MGMT family protein [Frankia]
MSRPRGRRDAPPASVSAGLGTRIRLGGAEPSPHAAEVLDAVARIPAGKVMTYGDVAEYVGAGTGRTVGAALSRYADDDLPWHRVIRASGEPNPAAPAEALRRLAVDRTPLSANGERVDLAAARWDGRPAADQRADRPPSAR